MLATMLQDFVCELEAQVERWAQELGQTLDLAKLEEVLNERMQRLCAGLVEHVLTELLSEPSYLEALQRLGGVWGCASRSIGPGGPGIGSLLSISGCAGITRGCAVAGLYVYSLCVTCWLCIKDSAEIPSSR